MTRKVAIVTAAILVQAGVIIGVGGTAWAVSPLTGTTNCANFFGTGTFTPKLSATGHGTTVKITFRGTVNGCVGPVQINGAGPLVTIVKGYVTGSGLFEHGATAPKCTSFEGLVPIDKVDKITMAVRWVLSGGPAVANSNVTYSFGPYRAPVGGGKMHLDLGAPPFTPTAVAGSFAGSLVQNTLMKIVTAPCPVGPAFAFPAGTMRF